MPHAPPSLLPHTLSLCIILQTHALIRQSAPFLAPQAVVMGMTADTALNKVFAKAASGVDLQAAWTAHGKPTSWGNVQRRFKDYQREHAASAATSQAASNATSKAASKATSKAASKASAAAATPSDTRTGARVTVDTRQTSHQVETTSRNTMKARPVAFTVAYHALCVAGAAGCVLGAPEGIAQSQGAQCWSCYVAPVARKVAKRAQKRTGNCS